MVHGDIGRTRQKRTVASGKLIENASNIESLDHHTYFSQRFFGRQPLSEPTPIGEITAVNAQSRCLQIPQRAITQNIIRTCSHKAASLGAGVRQKAGPKIISQCKTFGTAGRNGY